ncbi:MAG: hypothetical protein ACRDF8_06625, partial [Chloroflexota bacterium]
MAIQYSAGIITSRLEALTTAAGATGYLLIYTGAQPANCGDSASGTLLASLPMSNPIAPAPSGGILTLSAITSEAAGATGTAGYWRICTSSAGTTCVAQGSITATGGGGDLTFPSVAFTSGETIGITSF